MNNLCGPPLDVLQQVYVSPVLGTPHQDAVLQVRPHQHHRVEGQHNLSQPAGHASFAVAQDTVGFLGLLTHIQFAIHQLIFSVPSTNKLYKLYKLFDSSHENKI